MTPRPVTPGPSRVARAEARRGPPSTVATGQVRPWHGSTAPGLPGLRSAVGGRGSTAQVAGRGCDAGELCVQQAPNSLTRGRPSLRPNRCRARAARRQRSLDPFQWLPPRRSGPLRLPTARDSELQNAIDHARHPLHPFRGLRYSHWHRRRRRSRPPCHLSRRRRRHLVPNPSPIVDLVRHDRTRQRFGLRGGPRRRRSRRSRRSDRCAAAAPPLCRLKKP